MTILEMDEFGRMLCADGNHDWEIISKPGEMKVWKCLGCVEMKFEVKLIPADEVREPSPDDEIYILNPNAGPGQPLIVRQPDQTRH